MFRRFKISPKIGVKLRRSLGRKYSRAEKFLSSVKGRFFTGAIAIAPVIFSKCVSSKWVETSYPATYQWFVTSPRLMVFLEAWPFFVLVGTLIAGAIKEASNSKKLDSNTLLTIFVQIADTVGRKANCQHAKALTKLGYPTSPIHESTPSTQIQTLVENIWQVFFREAVACGMSETSTLKVTLARMNDDGTFHDFVYYLPANETPQAVDRLSGPDSGFAAAAAGRTTVVYQNIEETLLNAQSAPKFQPSRQDSLDQGSMICFPVQPQPLPEYPQVPYVVSIKCDEPEIFTTRKKARYELLLKPFHERICLEYYNLLASD